MQAILTVVGWETNVFAEECLREGNLTDALSGVKDLVRKHPADAKYRTFLFQLLCVTGDWERALTQLKLAGEMDSTASTMTQMYEQAIACEKTRQRVFSAEESPTIFGQPEQWVGLMVEALRLSAQGEYEKSQILRAQAFEEAPVTSGHIDEDAFEWIADADSRLGPILEVIINGRYSWLPFQNLKEIRVETPQYLRDCVWMPAYLTLVNGGEVVALIPTRYPSSESSDDGLIQLARKTAWEEKSAEMFFGLGQRMFATEAKDYSLMDVRHIAFEVEIDANTQNSESTVSEVVS